MPIYEYRCQACGIELEKLQKLSDPLLVQCPECGRETLVKLVSASSFRLKGGGWYETDFKTGKKKHGVGEADNAGDGPAAPATKPAATDGAAAAKDSAGESESDKSSSDKGSADKGSADKGSSDKSNKKGDSKGSDNTSGKAAAKETVASSKSTTPTSTGGGAG